MNFDSTPKTDTYFSFSKSSLNKLENLKSRKILFAFNLANNFVNWIKIFRQHEVPIELLIQTINESNPYQFANPLWEDNSFDSTIINYWTKPEGIHAKIDYVKLLWGYFLNRLNSTSAAKIAKKYDLVMSTPPGPTYFYKHKHNIIYDGGEARHLTHQKRLLERLTVKSYQSAEIVFYGGPDTKVLFERMGVETTWLPAAVDPEYYKPMPSNVENDKYSPFTIYMASRQDWIVKGNHHLIYAFARLPENTHLILTNWGVDIHKSKYLIEKLGLTKRVSWVEPTNKAELIKRYNQADVIADQFTLGGYGTATLEAMSCEKAVLIRIKEPEFQAEMGGIPPVINCMSIDEVEAGLKSAMDESYRNKIGKQARKWAIKHHHPIYVTDLLINALDSVF